MSKDYFEWSYKYSIYEYGQNHNQIYSKKDFSKSATPKHTENSENQHLTDETT